MAVIEAWSALGVSGYAATWERVQRCGVASTWTNLVIDDHPDHGDHGDHGAQHDQHDHHHRHHRRPAADVISLIERAELAPRVRQRAAAVYRALAEVEGAIHGIEPDRVELHEVGALDSILDVVGVCAALDALAIERVHYSPIAVGHGSVRTAHGLLPNPVPAVSRLLERAGAATTGLDTDMELSTPTGVALVTVLGASCGPMPSMAIAANGFGAGTADPPGRPNVVQAVIGELMAGRPDSTGRPAQLVEANVDDVTGEVLAHALTQLLAAGAFDAWATPIVMKKGRPAHTVSALCDEAHLAAVCESMIAETGTLGIRATRVERWPQHRIDDKVEVDGCTVRVKRGDGRIKVEHDDAVAAAQALGLPLRDVLARAEAIARDDR
jgi:uncharacterized protein (TIGR00299 family) protein